MTEISWPADRGPSKRWPIYTRGNIGEVYPNVVLPLEWDLAGLASENGWRRGAETIGFATEDDYGDGDFVVIGVFGGYTYFNVSLMRLLGVRTPGLGPEVIDTQFLGDVEVHGYRPRPGDRNLRATVNVIRTAVRTLRANKVPLLAEMRQRVDAHRASAPPLDAPDEVLWEHLSDDRSIGLWEYLIKSHVTITMQATIAAGRLTELCEKRLGDPNLAVTLTTGIGEVVSAQPARAMWMLANETPEDHYDDAFAAFLAEYGHRGPNEFSLAGRDWAAFPEIATAAIDTMRGVDRERSPTEQAQRMSAERLQAVSAAKARMGWRGRRLEPAINTTALWSRAREESKDQVIRANQPSRHRFLELLRRAAVRGGVGDHVGPMLLNSEEFLAYLADPPSMVSTIESRRGDYNHLTGLEPPFAFDTSITGGPPPISTWSARRTEGAVASAGTVLWGAAGAPGIATGRARVLSDPSDPTAMLPGEVLIAPLTDPSWTPLFVVAAAVVVEVGAAMSHSMIVSRELGIPCVVGVDDATLRIVDGTEVEVDGQAGTVTIA